MEMFVKGSREDALNIVDFADYIFSASSGPHNFAQLIPKLYGDGQDTQQYHYLVKEDGKIRAMVCVLPVTFNVAGIELKAGCVGTVSAHPRARGKGYMNKLLNMALDDMKAQGYAISMLGGQRQRYEYFGYEPAGVKLDFTLTADNIRHKYSGLDASAVQFEPLSDVSPWLDAAYALYEQGIVSGARSKEQFVTILQTWNSSPYAILRDGAFAGYVALSKTGGAIQEIELLEQSSLPVVSKALAAKFGLNSLHFTLPAYDREKLAILGDVSDMYSVGHHQSYNVMNFSAVIEAFMKCKASYTTLQDGKFTLRIEGCETVEVIVNSNQITVNRHEEHTADITADVSMSKREAIAFLFSPLSTYSEWMPSAVQSQCPQGWFPLPLYAPVLDCC
ncbi:GNAT family N-acetyltransferase [Paenibacillus marinisediminis]